MSEVTMWRRSPSKNGHVYLRAVSVRLFSVCGVALIALAFTPPKSVRDNIAVMTPPLAATTKLPGTLPPDSPLVLTIVLNRADERGDQRSEFAFVPRPREYGVTVEAGSAVLLSGDLPVLSKSLGLLFSG